MVQYDINEISEELMFTPIELKEVLDIYFEEAFELLVECGTAMNHQDCISIGKISHQLKGSSLNLRITTVAEIAIELEKISKSGVETDLTHYLPKMQHEIDQLKEYIDVYYAKIAE